MLLNHWNFIDKSTWKTGPWQQEPDRIEWVDDTTGLFCLILRKPSGVLSGYVGVPKDHLFFLKPHHLLRLWVHRGLSYCNLSQGDNETGIRYTPGLKDPGSLWWFGFSCDSEDDLFPSYRGSMGEYRDIEYVTQEIASLIEQIEERSRKAQKAAVQTKYARVALV